MQLVLVRVFFAQRHLGLSLGWYSWKQALTDST